MTIEEATKAAWEIIDRSPEPRKADHHLSIVMHACSSPGGAFDLTWSLRYGTKNNWELIAILNMYHPQNLLVTFRQKLHELSCNPHPYLKHEPCPGQEK